MPPLTTLSTQRASPKWTFRGKQSSAESKSGTPGPGAYTPIAPDGSSKYKKGPRILFGSSTRDGERRGGGAMSPGPGQYSPDFKGISKLSPRFGFGTSGRAVSNKYATPGPGTYNSSTTMGNDQPKYSIRARTAKDSAKNNNPGPGSYTVPQVSSGAFAGSSKAVQAGSPKWGFGTASRTSSGPGKGTPGPGAYDSRKFVASSPSYSMRGRHADMSSRMQTPGPGAHGDVYSSFG